MKPFLNALKKNKTAIIIYLISLVVNFAVFFLYGIMLEPAIYSAVIMFFFLVIIIIVDIFRSEREINYKKKIQELELEIEKTIYESSEAQRDALDYYTTWVHQIKTPIAVMRLKLSADTPENHALNAELFRIEQYVDMVLQYVRLGADTNDLVIAEYSIDELVRESIKKYASQFIEKKISLEYSEINAYITTDKKWYACIIDQILSNAIKYTTAGGTIKIYCENDRLSICDSGIGIEPEDIPRIFEKGYTGVNGRIGEKSSGLGLYLAQKAAKMLKLSISVESTPLKGSTFHIFKTPEKITYYH